jgi:tetratricopeptide (TPR) repeat protein
MSLLESEGLMKKALMVIAPLLLYILPVAAGKEKIVVPPPEKLAEASQLSKRADSFLARKFFEDAILEYHKVLAITPTDHVIHNKLGIAYHQVQNLNLAKKQYERARKLNPKYHEAWNNLGTANYGLKKYKRAVKDYKKALEIKADSATTHHNLAAAYFAMKKYEEGFQEYMEAYRLDPNILERVSSRGTIVRTAEVNQGIQNFYLAKLYITNGQPDKALAYLLKALETGFNDYEKITKDPDFKVLAQDERLTRFISQKPGPFEP